MDTENGPSATESQDSLSDGWANKTETPNRGSELPTLFLASTSATFVRRGKRYVPAEQRKLKNSLLAGVGFLELANAGDFAANVWNDVPVPTVAIGLMAVGGTLALALFSFAFIDVRLSWSNVRLLQQERHTLQRESTHRVEDGQTVDDLDTRLDVNFRELGTELIDRFCLDTFMGFGAALIGIGTLMAIGGAYRPVWIVSNLLSGYVGNAPLALYSVINGAWSVYVFIKAHQHKAAAAKALNGGGAATIVKSRFRNVQIYAAVIAATSIIGGAGSLIAATRWWGYVILIPVIFSSVFCNYFWRKRVGYDRPFVRSTLEMSVTSLVSEIEFVASVQHILKGTHSGPSGTLVSDPQSVASVVGFIVANHLFEDFCVRLLHNTDLSAAIFANPGQNLTIDSQSLLMADQRYRPRILEIARTCISKEGSRYFQYRGRYLTETLGSYLRIKRARRPR